MSSAVVINRTNARADGIFGRLTLFGSPFCVTLEHAFADDFGNFHPIVNPGTYTCIRGQHSLNHYKGGLPFQTFEVTGVQGHSGILFHPGNFNVDSDGCILLGYQLVGDQDPWYVTSSVNTFNEFMSKFFGQDSFLLTVASG